MPVERVEVLFVGKEAGQRSQHNQSQNPLALLHAFSVWQSAVKVYGYILTRQ
jgi:hypothetical protein